MARLSISLLGPIQITMDGQPVTGFKSNKVRALLVYLVMEANRPHPRERLAGLFWPDWTEREALSNLRYALSDLRQAIRDHTASPSFLIISRDSLQFNTASDHWLDAASFLKIANTGKTEPGFIEELEKATELYRGSFMEGFSVDDSPAFDEWALLNRERLARMAITSLHVLADCCEEKGEYEKAKSHAWRQLELEPSEESAHQQLMRVLALSGQRSAALAQYEACSKVLKEELGVQPSEETIKLNEQIRDGKFKAQRHVPEIGIIPATRAPFFLATEPVRVETPLVVARESELARMGGFLEQALAGQGRVFFITGEAGSGKTALIQEFMRRAQDTNKELIAANGNCNAYTGIGDPYLPFREILELLTGDVESRWAAGTITKDHALRLWGKLPVVARALADVGLDLIDTFVQRSSFLERAKASASGQTDWLTDLEKVLERKPVAVSSAAVLHQLDVSEQYTRVLQILEHKNPLLLILDDLQWADAGSINMLFHLVRRLQNNRILILGAYRAEEVALGRDGCRHPLEPVINEFRREFGDIVLNVDKIEGRKFIETFLNSEPNHLGPSFREMLYHQTQGQPLFTVELLRGLQARGDITKDAEGCWIEGESLDWEKLPVRVEAAIQERIRRLPEAQQKALTVASVEGETFTAEVVGMVRGAEKREILEALSGDLERKHRLVQAQSIQRVDGKPLSRYQFRHILFQKYLYGSLDDVERAHLHEQVGNALEELYGERVDLAANAVQLARHFEEAKIFKKVIHYLHLAGNKAAQLSAYQEAIAHLNRGLKFLESLEDSSDRDQQKLDLLLALGIAYQGTKGAQPIDVENVYTEALGLCQKIGNPSQMVQVLGGLAILYYVRGEHNKAKELAGDGLILAEKNDAPMLMLLCHWYLGFILFCLGDFIAAHSHLTQALNFYDPYKHHHALLILRGSDAGLGAMAYDICCLWIMGYPDQALKMYKNVISLSHEFGHPFSMADVLCFGGCLFNAMQREGEALESNANELVQLAKERNLTGWLATGIRYQGEALAIQGKIDDGIAQARAGMEAMQGESILMHFTETLSSLAEAQMKTGNLCEVIPILRDAKQIVEKNQERFWESELNRLEGEVHLLQGQVANAEASFMKAIEVSREQSAKSLELRAVMSLCRMWAERGKKAEARLLLDEIYRWFSEGFNTPDLIKAGKLLKDLS